MTPTLTLSNGVPMHILGLGTSHQGGYSHAAVVHALKNAGYTHIDTAERYGTEASICEDVKMSGVSREKIFITTKAWPSSYGYEELKKSLQCSLRNLGTDYVDLYLLHWPDVPLHFSDRTQCLRETWKAMEELYAAGLCKAIGVSNFLIKHLEEIFEICTVKPHVNQIEFHPYCYPKQLISFCRKHDIVVEGYCPLAKGEILTNKNLRAPIETIALKHGKTLAQVLVRWSVQHGVVTIPKSTKLDRVEENIAVFDFELSEGEMLLMDGLCDVTQVKATWDPQHMSSYKRHISNPVRDNSI